MSRCRFGYYDNGRVTRHVVGRQRKDIPKDEPSAPARLRSGPKGVMIVETEIEGSTWYGRLAPRKRGQDEGVVLLFESSRGHGGNEEHDDAS